MVFFQKEMVKNVCKFYSLLVLGTVQIVPAPCKIVADGPKLVMMCKNC